jgi:chromosomal replication initiator protein
MDNSQLKLDLLDRLKKDHHNMCRKWFGDVRVIGIVGGSVQIQVDEPVQLKYLQQHCTRQFSDAAQSVTGRLLGVTFIGNEELNADGTTVFGDNVGAGSTPASMENDMFISPDYSFDGFVIGPGNRLAHAAATAVSENPGQVYNPLFIHGGVGLGKTHLLQSICQTAMRANPTMRIYYVSCNGFMTQFLGAVQAGEMASFRNKFRAFDMLVIDDIHDLSKRDQTQEEFFHTFNTLFHLKKQIVLSSDASPNEIPDLEERLVSRFSCGLVACVEKPGFETRVAIINKKAALRDINIPDDVATYIASKLDSNIRQLEGAIIKLQSISRLDNAPIDLPMAKSAIGNESLEHGPRHVSIQDILDIVTEFYDVKLTELLSKKRHKSITTPRQVGMWLARKHTRFSLEEVGGYFGGRDHTTVMHAIKTVDKKLTQDTHFAHDIGLLEGKLSDDGAA